MSQSFPKAARLLKKSEFQRVYHKGVKLFGTYLLVYATTNHNSVSRIGISVPKRYGKAHDRNYFKRLLRESFRVFNFSNNYFDFHIMPKCSISDMNSILIKEEFTKVISDFIQSEYH